MLYKKKSSVEFLVLKGRYLLVGLWIIYEKCFFFSCIFLIRVIVVNLIVENIILLYNNVINFDVRKYIGYLMREKSII